MSWLLPCHCACKKSDKDQQEQVRTSLNDCKSLLCWRYSYDKISVWRAVPGHSLLSIRLFLLLLHSNACILVARPLLRCYFFYGTLGLLCRLTGIRSDAARVFERWDRNENMQWKWKPALGNTEARLLNADAVLVCRQQLWEVCVIKKTKEKHINGAFCF